MNSLKSPNNQNYNQNILGFVPSLIIQHLLEKESRKIPEKQSFKTVVMFADISGFTNLSEQLQKRGNEGSELLAFVLNRYMELLIKSIGRSGGDIFKFAGDAMIVLWPPPRSTGPQLDFDLLTLLRQAVQSGLDIKNRLNGAVMFEGKISLSVKIGFGIGDVTIMHVGGVFQRAEYLPAGDPLTQAFECEHHATGGGQVIVSTQVWQLIHDYFNMDMIQEAPGHMVSKNAPFYLVNNLKSGQSAVQMKADALLIRTKIGQGAVQAILPLLESYIPKALLPYIKIDQEKWSAELRRLSVMFLNLGVDLTLAKTEEGLIRIQLIIKTVQSCLYQNEGSLNKLLMDDKGSTLIVVFGLPPLAHQDDSVRGILAAFKLRDELSKINCPCSIGLTTGLVFTGVVGTSGNRREYSVLGDTVNLSARLMQAACGEKDFKILVDEETKRDAEHKIKFKFFECRTVKGKTGQIPIYAPINTLDEIVLVTNTEQLRTHLYNVPDDLFLIEQYKDSLFMLRREKETDLVLKQLWEFLEKMQSKIILIKGEYGIGKTLFLRCMLEALKAQFATLKRTWRDETLFIFIAGFNSLLQKKKINGWRAFMRFAIEKLRARFKVTNYKEVILNTMRLENWRLNVIERVLDLDPVESAKKEIVIEKEKISKEDLGIIKDFLFDLIDKLIEKDFSPLVLCFDDMQNFDDDSWVFLLQIIEAFKKKVFFFFVIRDCQLEAGINSASLHKYLKKLQKFMKHEERTMHSIKINLKEIKIVDSLALTRKILGANDIPDNLLYFIHQKTKGNPLKVINLIQTILQLQLLQKNMDSIIISQELNSLFYINEFITLPVPLSSLKINSPILDKLSCKQILLMKVASIIGDTFNLTVLKRLNPFKDQGLPNDEIEVTLQELERNEIIGIIDETESNIVYQFTDLFMREVLYQRMTYNQRRELHKLFAESMQNVNTDLSINTKDKASEKIQTEKLMFHWKLAENKSEDIVPKNPLEKPAATMMTGFSQLAKRSVIVKKISSLASTKYLNPLSTLRKGYLQYKFVRGLMYSRAYFVLSFKDLKFYSDEQDFEEKPEKFNGLISLKQIFSIAFMSEKKRTVLLLRTGSYQTRDNKDLGLVHMNFAHEEFDVLEEWATYIEFARAKAIYDDFVNTFGKISFPLQSDQRMIKKEKSLRKKVKNKIEGSQSSMSININMKEKNNVSESIKDFRQGNVSYLQLKQQTLKESLNVFINQAMLLFLSNIIEKSSSELSKDKQNFLGKNNVFSKRFPNFFKIKQSLLEDEEVESKILDRNFSELLQGKKKSVSIDLRTYDNQRFRSGRSIQLDSDENFVEIEAKANIPSESTQSHLRTRIKSTSTEMQQSSIKTSSINEKSNQNFNTNNNNKVFTFNSNVSLELAIDPNKKISGGGGFTGAIEIARNTSGLLSSQGGIASTPRLNMKLLSQIQEEENENDPKMWNFQKGEYKLKSNIKRRFWGKDPEYVMPHVFYSRKNSLGRKNGEERRRKKSRKRKVEDGKTRIYKEEESEKINNLNRTKQSQITVSKNLNFETPKKKTENQVRTASEIKISPSIAKESPQMSTSKFARDPQKISSESEIHNKLGFASLEKKKTSTMYDLQEKINQRMSSQKKDNDDMNDINMEESWEIVKIRNNESNYHLFKIFLLDFRVLLWFDSAKLRIN